MAEKITREQVFNELNKIDLTDKIQKKLGLNYVSWAVAWGEIKKRFPCAEYKIHQRQVATTVTTNIKVDENTTVTKTETYTNSIPYFTDGMTCFVMVSLTIEGQTETEVYPIMNNKNQSVSAELVKSVDVNKALQRALAKVCARFGLGLYVYSGEDLPEDKRLDFKSLVAEVDHMNFEPLSEEMFNNCRDKVINYIKAQEEVDPKLYAYIQSLFPNKKLSAITFAEDSLNLNKLSYIIDKISA